MNKNPSFPDHLELSRTNIEATVGYIIEDSKEELFKHGKQHNCLYVILSDLARSFKDETTHVLILRSFY